MELTKLQQWVALTVLVLVLLSTGFTGALLILDAATSGSLGAVPVSLVPLLALDLATSLLVVLMGTLLLEGSREAVTREPGDIEELIRRTVKEVIAEEFKKLEEARGGAPQIQPLGKPLGEELRSLGHRGSSAKEPSSQETPIQYRTLTGKKVSLDDSDLAVWQRIRIFKGESESSKPAKEEKKEEKGDKENKKEIGNPRGERNDNYRNNHQ